MSDPESETATTADDTTTRTDPATDHSHTDRDNEYDFSVDPTAASTPEDGDATTQRHPESELEAVRAQVEVLQEENRRLRADYVRARQARYQRAALALGLLGLVAGLGGLVFPAARELFGGLAGIGIVLAILIYYITPQRIASATVGERSYATLAHLAQELSAELGLQETRIYVPTPTAAGPARDAARLFVPLHQSYTVPAPDALTSMFLVETAEQTRGVSLPPTGSRLLREVRQSMVDDLATTPADLTAQITDALTAGFELVDDAGVDLDPAEGTATIGVQGSTFGSVARFDHPVPSFVATTLAVGLQTPVELAAVTTDDDEFDAVLTCTWDTSAGADAAADAAAERGQSVPRDADTEQP